MKETCRAGALAFHFRGAYQLTDSPPISIIGEKRPSIHLIHTDRIIAAREAMTSGPARVITPCQFITLLARQWVPSPQPTGKSGQSDTHGEPHPLYAGEVSLRGERPSSKTVRASMLHEIFRRTVVFSRFSAEASLLPTSLGINPSFFSVWFCEQRASRDLSWREGTQER